jgi:hypothetical protein
VLSQVAVFGGVLTAAALPLHSVPVLLIANASGGAATAAAAVALTAGAVTDGGGVRDLSAVVAVVVVVSRWQQHTIRIVHQYLL